jgi:hypothetical protein
MPYKRSVVVKLEGAELTEFVRAWRGRWGLEILTSRLSELMAQQEEAYGEAWRVVREHHNLEDDDLLLLFDRNTGEIYRREWVQEPTEGDHERDETEQ